MHMYSDFLICVRSFEGQNSKIKFAIRLTSYDANMHIISMIS